jgi:hypothetical protein
MAMAKTSSPENYSLGRGRLYFNRKISAGVYDGERDLGNAPDFNVSVKVDWLEHFSSRSGLKSKDKRIASMITPDIAFTLDEIVAENLALTFMADISTVTQVLGTALTASFVSKKSRFFELGKTKVSNVVVEVGIIVKVVDVDYTVDLATGRIYIPEGSSIIDATTVDVTFDCAADSVTKLSAFKQYSVEGVIRFVSDNPTGQNMSFQAWNVSLTPDGDLAMIGDKWMETKFKGEMLRDEAGHPNNPYCELVLGA